MKKNNKISHNLIKGISIKWKILIPLLAIFTLAILIQLNISNNSMRDNLTSQLNQKGVILSKTLSYAIAEPLSLGVIGNIQDQLDSILKAEKEIAYINVIDIFGIIKASTTIDNIDKALGSKELNELVKLTKINTQCNINSQMIHMDIPVSIEEDMEGLVVGYIQLELTMKHMLNAKKSLIVSSYIIFILLLSISIGVFSYIATKTIINPIKIIEHTATEVAQGNLNKQIPIESDDELGYFSKTFNEMVKSLKKTKNELHKHVIELALHRDNLEELVEKRTMELESTNKQLTDSINYAASIQNSILPFDNHLNHCFDDYFIIWNPRDIVGGDFYWFYDANKQIMHNKEDSLIEKSSMFLIGVIDCTGHGVPGALMTMVANSLLNQTIENFCFDNPAYIIKELNRLVRLTLNHDKKDAASDDGMDLGLCLLDHNNNRIIFSGAKSSIFYTNTDSVLELKGDKQSVGYNRSREDFEYTNHEIKMTKGMNIYMISDGYIEQCGGKKNLPYGKNRLKKLLDSISHLPMIKQKAMIEKEINEYIGDEHQADDITVFGFTC
jgi:serine phosphatase RsbU (regulator of sigma subunit)